ncbi:MAG: cell division protein FtsL [Actinomycetota bacterium]|nr:cell division protein FtsL [Actinomycetota bacterium]
MYVEQPVRGRPDRRGTSKGAPGRAPRGAWRRGSRLGRPFVVLVVPVLLMLGSVYVHTMASKLKGEETRLEEAKAQAEGEAERLEVRITELSEPGRIRSLAREKLGMRDPGKDLETYGSEGGDVVNGGGEKDKRIGE